MAILGGRQNHLSGLPVPPPPGSTPHHPGINATLEDKPNFFPNDTSSTNPIWNERKLQVTAAYKHALAGYLAHAFPNDELAPISGNYTNKYNGWGVSLIDSLDTMWIMGLREEFNHSLSHVASLNFTLPPSKYMPFFETTIRYLGGLLSAYALSGSPILLSRADDLGQKLLPAFNGTESGLPSYSVHPVTGKPRYGWMGLTVNFAEATSCQLEFKYLAKLTGRVAYYEQAERVMSIVYGANVSQGLFPDYWDGKTGKPMGSHLSAGAGIDSGYEYLLKQYLLMGDTKARDQYIESANGIINNLVYISPNRSLLYATDLPRGIQGPPSHRYEHLTCFLPGMLALGAHTVKALSEEERKRHMWAARGLAYTCYISYADQASGLGPDVWQMVLGGRKWVDVLKEWEEGNAKEEKQLDVVQEMKEGGEGGLKRGVGDIPPGLGEPEKQKSNDSATWEERRSKRDYYNAASAYMLRPETIESLFLLWKMTGEEKWRERGWEIFQSLEENSKTKYGYANVASVDGPRPFRKDDDMPSWFLAETLKYFYLLFDDSNTISLDSWVLNTEAHPLPKFTWTEWEKAAYNISY
ncbi:glycoside hydrolase family 47 protein [Amanita muscaria Koide BX008]|uniref:alpha-1,2-Mannosidase n=1 Tax=Amanita muscaria (strain Koide BX008) TaxID=946122 RepID=A0A0C2X964_AMAMK|nr:glycoside hydrolase family 47 protein [Amanita muscaria Koide BX008]